MNIYEKKLKTENKYSTATLWFPLTTKTKVTFHTSNDRHYTFVTNSIFSLKYGVTKSLTHVSAFMFKTQSRYKVNVVL